MEVPVSHDAALCVAVIIPVHNGGANFRLCLEALARAVSAADALIVVADGDSDDSWRLAQEFGATTIRLPNPSGPARARNLGAARAKADILFFIDADVTIQPDAIGRVRDYFSRHPETDAIIGPYDDAPSETNFLSQYKNLFHHFTRQTANPEASTFWSGCGAVRRHVVKTIHGFDGKPCRPLGNACPGTIEDVEPGYRLKEAGHTIRLLKDLQVKHLRRWEALPLLKAEFFYRALPWTELLRKRGGMVNALKLWDCLPCRQCPLQVVTPSPCP